MPADPQTLRDIFTREARHRPHWPQVWEVARHDPLILAILRTMAAHPKSFGRRASAVSTVSIQPMLTHWRPASPHTKRAGGLDFKSLAAGEKPEPEEP